MILRIFGPPSGLCRLVEERRDGSVGLILGQWFRLYNPTRCLPKRHEAHALTARLYLFWK